MKQITITISDEEEKILLTDMIDIEEWLNNFVRTKVRQICHQVIIEKTDRRPDKMTDEEKIKLVASMKLETAEERNKRLEQEIKNERKV